MKYIYVCVCVLSDALHLGPYSLNQALECTSVCSTNSTDTHRQTITGPVITCSEYTVGGSVGQGGSVERGGGAHKATVKEGVSPHSVLQKHY